MPLADAVDQPSAVGILIAGVNCLMTIFSMYTMDRIGRRRIFLIGLPVMIVALVIASVAFHFMTEPTGGQLVRGTDYDQTWVGLMVGMIVLFIIGYAPSLGTLAYTTIELIRESRLRSPSAETLLIFPSQLSRFAALALL